MGEEGLMTLCVKIGYSEPTQADSRDGSSAVAESSRATSYSIRIG